MQNGGIILGVHIPLFLEAVLFAVLLAGVILSIFIPLFIRRYQKRLANDQNRFVALASHYLLTPISIIQTATARLEEAEAMAPGEREKLYTAIIRGERRLWLTVQQLITANAVTMGSLRVESHKVADLAEVVSNAIKQIYPFAQERGISFKLENRCRLGTQTHLDVKYTTLAISAILDNSVKFSPEKAEVHITLEGGEGDQDFSVTIRDVGSGMPASVVRRVGERFYRGTQLYTFDYEGLGLGLYIARTLIGLQEGTFNVSSQPRKGTEVKITLPS